MNLSTLSSQILIVVVVFVPGLTYLWTYERLVGRLTLTGTERLLRAITMSAVVYAVFAPWVVRLLTRGAAGEVRSWKESSPPSRCCSPRR